MDGCPPPTTGVRAQEVLERPVAGPQERDWTRRNDSNVGNAYPKAAHTRSRKNRTHAASRSPAHITLRTRSVKGPRFRWPDGARGLNHDFVRAVEDIFFAAPSDYERALQLRFLLAASDQPEEVLPVEVRHFLQAWSIRNWPLGRTDR